MGVLGKVFCGMAVENLKDDLRSVQPPIFPRSWEGLSDQEVFETEFSHDDPEVCLPPGCNKRLKVTLNLRGPDIEEVYCGHCKQTFSLNTLALRLIYGVSGQNKYHGVIKALLSGHQ